MLTSIDEYTDELSLVSEERPWIKLILNINRIGLTLHKLIIRNELGQDDERDILSGPETSQALKTEGRRFMNQVVGRYANRLPAGHQVKLKDINNIHNQITLDIENNEPCQNNPTRGNCLHGGTDGYDLREFKRVDEHSDIVQELHLQTSNKQQQQQERVYYHLHSHSGDQGFPESIDILATITLDTLSSSSSKNDHDDENLHHIGRARFDLKAKISNSNQRILHHHTQGIGGTPINLTWHSGYLLNDFKALKPDQPGIYQHKLWINTNQYLQVDECQLPTGEIKSIDSLGLHFTPSSCSDKKKVDNMKTIKEIMPNTGFDHCFLFNRSGTNSNKQEIANEMTCKVVLSSPKNDLKLKFYTNQDSVQCYSANYFDGSGTRKELHRNPSLVNQSGYNKHESIYLEFQQPSSLCTNSKLQKNFKAFLEGNNEDKDNIVHDNQNQTMNQSNFSNYTTILYPNQVYHSWFFIDLFI